MTGMPLISHAYRYRTASYRVSSKNHHLRIVPSNNKSYHLKPFPNPFLTLQLQDRELKKKEELQTPNPKHPRFTPTKRNRKWTKKITQENNWKQTPTPAATTIPSAHQWRRRGSTSRQRNNQLLLSLDFCEAAAQEIDNPESFLPTSLRYHGDNLF